VPQHWETRLRKLPRLVQKRALRLLGKGEKKVKGERRNKVE
jgi:hypothetical protein